MRLLLLTLILTACNWGPFKKDNHKKDIPTSEVLNKINVALTEVYCPKVAAKYIEQKGKFHECDSALFGGLAGVACPGVDILPFEKEGSPGQMCRTWDCDCYDPETKTDNGSDSQYSKDMNVGIQLNLAVNRNEPELVDRIVKYLTDHSLIMCDAINEPTKLSKCVLPPDSMLHWIDMQKGSALYIKAMAERHKNILGLAGFRRHLSVLEALKEGEIYGGISAISLENLRSAYRSETNNVVYAAAWGLYFQGDMRNAADKWMAQCPIDRLPNNHQDWCADYKFQRDENGADWNVCPDENFKEHTGVDCAFAAWIILHNQS